jgi:hypothetical protein
MAGQTLFVRGGSGGAGSYVVQLAKVLGAKVAASCSTANVDYLRNLGVDLVIDYWAGRVSEELKACAPEGVDAIIDLFNLGGRDDPLALVKRGGVYIGIETLDASVRIRTEADGAARGVQVKQLVARRADGLAEMPLIGELMAAGGVKPPILEILPLEQAGEALMRLRSGHTRGKLLLMIDEGLDSPPKKATHDAVPSAWPVWPGSRRACLSLAGRDATDARDAVAPGACPIMGGARTTLPPISLEDAAWAQTTFRSGRWLSN